MNMDIYETEIFELVPALNLNKILRCHLKQPFIYRQ